MIIKIYALIAAIVTLLLDIPFDIFGQQHSLWLVPLALVCAFVALIILHAAIFALSIVTVNLNKPPRDTNFFRLLVKGFFIIYYVTSFFYTFRQRFY